jgi:hypothetical protein
MHAKYFVLTAVVLSASISACGSDDDGAGSGGSSGGGAGGSSASGGSAGSATGGSAGSSGSGGSAGSGGTPGACGAIPTFADGLAPTSEIHVATNGNDNNDGSAQNPVATLDHAATLATPGTAIRIHAGTYAGGAYIDNLAGTAAAPIWIGGAPGEAKPVFDGGGEAFHLTRVRYLVVHDLEVRNMTANGINIDDGGDYANAEATRFVVFDGVDVHDIGGTGNQDCLKMSGVNDFWVLGSHFARCGGASSGSGIDHVGCHHGVIARSRFEQMSGNAVQSKGGSEDIEIRWNLIEAGGARALNLGGSTGFEFFRPPLSASAPNAEARNIRAIANVIVGSAAPIAFVGCVDCLAANNTIVDPENWIIRILQETTTGGGYTFLPAQNGSFVNNLVYFDRSGISTYVNVGPDTSPATFSFSNNLWYAHDDPAESQPTNLPSAESGGIAGQDPALVNPTGGDFHIPTASPAADAGTAVSGVSGDYDGACYASPPSIGAFEAG